jgi:hypothetical protein
MLEASGSALPGASCCTSRRASSMGRFSPASMERALIVAPAIV